MTITRVTIAALVALLAAPRPSAGQDRDSSHASGLGATREALEASATRLEQGAQSADAAREAAAIRMRLSRGDFGVGDRVLLAVEGEPALSDTFTVGLGSTITLPTIGDVSLQGVLRSEVQDYLTRRIGQNLRDPVVRATPYVRLSIVGAVARPGYYPVSAAALLSDALMAAGGPTPNAKMKDMRIEREGHAILEKKALQHAVAAGTTIDEAGLIAGDQYVIPGGGTTGTRETIGFIALLLTIPLTVYSLTQISK